jgi:hypothetical protein
MATLYDNIRNGFNSFRTTISEAISPQKLANDISKLDNKVKTTEIDPEENPMAGMGADSYNASAFSTVFSLGVNPTQNINDLIKTYRNASQNSFVSDAVDEITETAIWLDDVLTNMNPPVKLSFNDKNDTINTELKDKITAEFSSFVEKINFKNKAHEYFRQWLVDGRLLVQPIFQEGKIEKGIIDIKIMNPLNWKLVYDKTTDKKYWINSKEDKKNNMVQDVFNMGDAIKPIPEELIIKIESGIKDKDHKLDVSFLHYAIKDINRLVTLEDHFLIYRIVRAPERRVFYIDPGNLPARKSEEYLKNVIKTYSQKKYYNDTDGTLMSKSQHPSILEDFFLLRKNGKGTEISTLPSGGNLQDLDDLLYFQRRASKSLKVPFSRINYEDRQSQSISGSPTSDEMTNEENKFYRFVFKLRRLFSKFFTELLKKQLSAKNVLNDKKWQEICKKINIIYNTDTKYLTNKRLEKYEKKMNLMRDALEYIGKFVTVEQLHKDIWGRTDEEIEEFLQTVQNEKQKYPNFYQEDDSGSGW